MGFQSKDPQVHHNQWGWKRWISASEGGFTRLPMWSTPRPGSGPWWMTIPTTSPPATWLGGDWFTGPNRSRSVQGPGQGVYQKPREPRVILAMETRKLHSPRQGAISMATADCQGHFWGDLEKPDQGEAPRMAGEAQPSILRGVTVVWGLDSHGHDGNPHSSQRLHCVEVQFQWTQWIDSP